MSSVRLALEHTATPQSQTEIAYHGGQLVVGRGDDADWRIDDPDKFISRKHFVISQDGDAIVVTDASTGGLFVDGAKDPLGVGNSAVLEDGMRLRFGDFVVKVEIGMAQPASPSTTAATKSSPFSFEFEPLSDPTEQSERPDTLPEPFGVRSSNFFDKADADEEEPVQPIDRDDPFALDLKAARTEQTRDASEATFGSDGGGYFPLSNDDVKPIEPDAAPAPDALAPPPQQVAPAAPVGTSDSALREAFYRGLGLDPRQYPNADPETEMEALGRRFRALTDGLLHLLKTRAEERQKVRVAQTIIGSANVNPVKFAVGTDDAVASLVTDKGSGYLDPDAAISESYRDLIDHQVRTWAALQSALRQMIDKFDPEEIEREMEDTGLLEALIAGGRNAKLWQLYQDRYQTIASNAEKRFLGEIGAEFRDAYENKGRTSR